MNENVRAFLEAVKGDPALRERLREMAVNEVIAAAREKGIELAEKDLKPASDELGEDELNNVAGGGGGGCLIVGGAGGVDDDDDKIYGCACVIYGQGGDGRAKDANCVCFMAGGGKDYYQLLNR